MRGNLVDWDVSGWEKRAFKVTKPTNPLYLNFEVWLTGFLAWKKLISKLIFAGCTGSKDQVRNKLKIQFIELDFSNLIFQKSGRDQQGGKSGLENNEEMVVCFQKICKFDLSSWTNLIFNNLSVVVIKKIFNWTGAVFFTWLMTTASIKGFTFIQEQISYRTSTGHKNPW